MTENPVPLQPSLPGLSFERIRELRDTVFALRERAHALEGQCEVELSKVGQDHLASARNLIHYLAIRQHDVRPLQRSLTEAGLSSLGAIEGHVIASLNAVHAVFDQLDGDNQVRQLDPPPVNFRDATRLLNEHTDRILGPAPGPNTARVMVTMPAEAAAEPQLIESFLAQGMNIMRINCAHDDREVWAAMIANLRRVEEKLGKKCRLAFDLGGPKLRTGPIEPGPEV